LTAATHHRRLAALAGERHVHRAFHWLHLHEPQIRRWQLETLAIPAPPFNESARAHWFLDRFKHLGLSNPHIDAEGNALAELLASTRNWNPETGNWKHEPALTHNSQLKAQNSFSNPAPADPQTADSPVILLSAHLDTVFPPGTDTTPREEGDRIICPGACDNAAGLAALLAIASALKHSAEPPPCTILFAANVGEEGEGDLRGMRHLFTASPYATRIRSVIALEGSGTATVIDRALGSRRLRVYINGPGGHSWADAGRPNAILALSSALLAVNRLRLPSQPRTTLNVGVIRGGTSINSIPDSATADLDLRSTSSTELDRTELSVLHTLTAAIETENRRPTRFDTAQTEPLRLSVERIGSRAAGALSSHSPLAGSLRAVDRHLAIATESRIGSTDANMPLSVGIPAIAIGAGGTGGGIHTLNEWYDPTGRELALRRILLLLLDTCTQIAATHCEFNPHSMSQNTPSS
jgi:tripeptide aminopeptidase